MNQRHERHRCHPSAIWLISLLWLALARASFAADGAAIAQHGNQRGVPACAACHGALGEGMPIKGFPKLAGLNADYLETQLNAFADGERVNAMMAPIAKILTADERAAMARYYAKLNNPVNPNADRASHSLGERLAVQGRWRQGLPACTQCHGAQGVGVGSRFPALAGQSSLYIENQLHAWQGGTRARGPMGLMKVIAAKLSDADIHEVAAYFSSLPAAPAAAGGAS